MAAAGAGAGAGRGGGVNDIVRWWISADPERQFVTMLGAGAALLALLGWSLAVVALLCGWQPWAR